MQPAESQIDIKSYSGDIVGGSLLIPESIKIARLLIENADKDTWYQAIVVDNILQKRNPASAKRQTKLIRNRLELMTPGYWEIVVTGSSDTVTQALLAATIKQCHLLGDFMNTVIRDNWNTFNRYITYKNWDDFIEMCIQVDPKIEEWSNTTKDKIKQVVFRILAESKYIDGIKTLQILPVSIVPEVYKYLVKNSEDYIIRCMDITR